MAKTIKPLTVAQQHVVEHMKDGWELHSQRESFGGRVKADLCLRKGTELKRLHRGLLAQLAARGLILPAEKVDWLTTRYVLSDRS